MKNQSKTDYNSLLTLVKEQQWLLDRHNELSELLGSCKEKTECDLIYELLNRFFFLYQEDMDHCWKEMVNQIFNVWKLNHKDTQIVAIAKGDHADSSQAVLNMLKMQIGQIGQSVPLTSTIEASIKYVERKPCMVIVDEFIGSGDTVKSRIEYLKKEFDAKQIRSEVRSKIKIYICVVAAMEHSLQDIVALTDGIFAVHRLKKGISDYYIFPQLKDKIDIMLQMESRLEYSPDSPFFPFGYKKSEALYGVDKWNAVNNLFPVFWWDKLRGGKRRRPLFIRVKDVKD